MLRGVNSQEQDLLDQIFGEIAPDMPPMPPEQRRPEDYYERARQVVEWQHKKEFTTGFYQTENESADAFDRAVPHDLFKVHREVCGTLISPRPAQSGVRMRIDRILVPKPKLLDEHGWRFGIVGCELKCSGEKVGPAIAQAMDYSRTVWLLDPDRQRFRICLDYVFIWPMAKFGGTLASICAQNRIGSAYGDEQYTKFGLKSGETGILDVQTNGRVRVGKVLTGTRSGSR